MRVNDYINTAVIFPFANDSEEMDEVDDEFVITVIKGGAGDRNIQVNGVMLSPTDVMDVIDALEEALEINRNS